MSAPSSRPLNGVLKLSWPEPRGYWEIPVLYEDDHLLAINKPACLLTSPDRYDPRRPNLMAMLHRGIAQGSPWAKERGLSYLANAHRLDFETTGVLLLAKDKAALRALADQFGGVKPRKVYFAIVQGTPSEAAWEVDLKLGQDARRPGAMRVDQKHGKKALTRFELAEAFSGWSLLRCLPETGRTHQIRVHAQSAGLPIAGDELYGGGVLLLSQLKRDYRLKPGRVERPLTGTLALHAAELTVTHPVTGQPVTVQAPLPKAMQVALKYLRQYATVPAFPA